MSRKYVSTEFNCWRIFVISHRSASIKLAVDSLVLFVSGLRLIRRRGRKSVWQIVSSQSLNSLDCLYVHNYTLFITSSALNVCLLVHNFQSSCFTECHWSRRNAKGYRSMTVRLLLGGPNNRHGHHYPTIPCGPLFKQIEFFFFSGILTVYFNCNYTWSYENRVSKHFVIFST